MGDEFSADEIKTGLESVVGIKLDSSSSDAKPEWVSMGNNQYYKFIGYTRNSNNDGGQVIIQGKKSDAVAQLVADLKGTYQVNGGTSSSSSSPTMVDGSSEGAPVLWVTDSKNNSFGNNNFDGIVKISQASCTFEGEKPTQSKNFEQTTNKLSLLLTKEVMPSVPTPLVTPKKIGAINSPKGNSTLTFPLDATNDPKDSEGRYYYEVSSIDLSGKTTVNIEKNVVFYLTGNMTMSGNPDFVTKNGSKLEIYGGNGTTNITLNGKATAGANIFIHAPNAHIGVNGGGNSNPNIAGSIWAKSWGLSDSNSGILIGKPGTYGDYIVGENRQVPETSNPSNPVTTYDNVGQMSRVTRQAVK